MNEAETRAEYIDPALKARGWGVVDGSRIRREKSAYEITPGRILGGGKRNKPEIADYVLEYRNTKLAVIEAKAWDRPYTEGVAQAKSYAKKLNVRFTYASNGQKIYSIDMLTGIETDVAAYPTPDELWRMTFAEQNVWLDRFSAIPFEDKGGTWGARYYQDNAINKVLEAMAANKERILLTLATGTGKTFIAFQLAWKLFHSRWNLIDWKNGSEPSRRPRILFLADRNILADQAYNSFSAFPEDALVRIDPDDIRKKGKVPKNGNVFFTIFQTFMSGPGDSPYFGEYPADFFDFIIIDECHRGGANDEGNWRAILDYFAPAVHLGLTATPKRKGNVDTYEYFGGKPVYIYSLKEGINDGFLTPFKVCQIVTTLDEYVHVPGDGVVVSGEVVPNKRYMEADFNRIIKIPAREAYRVKLFMEMINQNEKTIVFCATQEHALEVRDLINQMKTSKDVNYCMRVTADDGERGELALREFQDNEKSIPTILTTSQKLSTGVDARNVRNIVLMRPVTNMIEFKQIIGRGTRLFDSKEYFTIYDFVKAHHLFNDEEWDGEPVDKTTTSGGGNGGEDKKDEKGESSGERPEPPLRAEILTVKLSDGSVRKIKSMTSTMFWGADGTPLSAAQFLENLFGTLPDFFKNEDELRAIWSAPNTRKALLLGLEEKGFGKEILDEMQIIIEAEKSDLFDVLGYVAYAKEPITRDLRAAHAKTSIHNTFNAKQEAFIDFVLAQYVTQGVEELDSEKLSPLLRLKYNNAIADAVADLGKPDEISKLFVGFQTFLYQKMV